MVQIAPSTASIADTIDSEWTAVDPTESESPLGISLSPDPTSKRLLVTLTPPKSPQNVSDKAKSDVPAKRAPLDICCVIDTSGSMGSEAPIPGDPAQGSKAESTGLSVLDVVKHSLRTIIATMKKGKRILRLLTLHVLMSFPKMIAWLSSLLATVLKYVFYTMPLVLYLSRDLGRCRAYTDDGRRQETSPQYY